MPPPISRPATRHVLASVLAVACVILSGCGQGDAARAGGAPSSRLVDFTLPPPYVNALEIEPGSGDFLLTTNRGFFRIDRESERVIPVRGRISAGGRSATVSTFLQLAVQRPGRLAGSGHPDQEGALPTYLGVIASDDGGRSWRSISGLGDADMHRIVFAHGRLYAYDAVLNALVQSADGGRTFTEQFTPTGAVIIDFAVDPANASRIVASSDSDLYRSDDAGASWRVLGNNAGIRLAWPTADALYRALKDGSVQRSDDRGATWRTTGRVGGEPYKLKAIGRDELYLALSDGTILHTEDGARTWDEAFRP